MEVIKFYIRAKNIKLENLNLRAIRTTYSRRQCEQRGKKTRWEVKEKKKLNFEKI